MPLRYVAGRWLHYLLHGSITGNQPPIVLLHHGFGHAGGWGDFPNRLRTATGRAVLSYSREGCGRSQPLGGARARNYLEREASEVLPALLNSLSIHRACLYGHSDGATIALIAAAEQPDLVETVVAEAPHVFIEEKTIAGVAATAQRYRDDSRFRRAVQRSHTDPEGAFGSWRDIWLDPDFATWSIERLLPKISAPLFLIQGYEDEFATLEQIDRIRSTVRGPVSTLIIEGCDHQPHRRAMEIPGSVAAFLDKNGSGPSCCNPVGERAVE